VHHVLRAQVDLALEVEVRSMELVLVLEAVAAPVQLVRKVQTASSLFDIR
jgi:hypothetical protein